MVQEIAKEVAMNGKTIMRRMKAAAEERDWKAKYIGDEMYRKVKVSGRVRLSRDQLHLDCISFRGVFRS